jgi:hypothetical protein
LREAEERSRGMAVTKLSLLERLARTVCNIDDIFTTAEHWNDNVRKEGEEPIDPDPDGQLKVAREHCADMVRKLLAK